MVIEPKGNPANQGDPLARDLNKHARNRNSTIGRRPNAERERFLSVAHGAPAGRARHGQRSVSRFQDRHFNIRLSLVESNGARAECKRGAWRGRVGLDPGLVEVVMDRDELMAACRALPDAVEEFPFGDEVSVFKVSGKMLAACRLGGRPRQLSLKCDPDVAVQLPAGLFGDRAGYHLNNRHWNTVTLDGSLPDEMVTGLLGDSWSRRCRRHAGRPDRQSRPPRPRAGECVAHPAPGLRPLATATQSA